jgi:hypothetical protein
MLIIFFKKIYYRICPSNPVPNQFFYSIWVFPWGGFGLQTWADEGLDCKNWFVEGQRERNIIREGPI